MKPIHTKSTLLSIALLGGSIISSQAAVLIPVDASSFDRGSGAANGTGTGGLLQTTTLELGLTKTDPNDPSTWTTTANWNNDWQGQDARSASLTTKPWVIYDLGSSQTGLSQMFIINVSEATGWSRGLKTFNLWYTNDPSTNTIPVWASSNNLSDGATNVKNYDFASGGWTKLNVSPLSADRGVDDAVSAGQYPVDGTYDLSGIASARYIGLEMLTSWADDGTNPFGTATGNSARVGLNQIAFTTIPEPSVAIISCLGFLMLLRRRKR